MNYFMLLLQGKLQSPHVFDSTVSFLVYNEQKIILVSADDTGTLCVWELADDSQLEVVLVASLNFGSRVEGISISPGGSHISVSLAKRLLLIRNSCGRLYVASELDSESTLSTSMAYSCSFDDEFIHISKVIHGSDCDPHNVVIKYWRHEYLPSFSCSFR